MRGGWGNRPEPGLSRKPRACVSTSGRRSGRRAASLRRTPNSPGLLVACGRKPARRDQSSRTLYRSSGRKAYAWTSQPERPAPILLCRGTRNDIGANPHGARFCGNRTCGRFATQSAVALQARAAPWSRASRSCGYGKPQRVGSGRHLSELDFFGNHAQRKRFGLERGFLGARAVYRHAWQLWNVGNPPAIGFAQ